MLFHELKRDLEPRATGSPVSESPTTTPQNQPANPLEYKLSGIVVFFLKIREREKGARKDRCGH